MEFLACSPNFKTCNMESKDNFKDDLQDTAQDNRVQNSEAIVIYKTLSIEIDQRHEQRDEKEHPSRHIKGIKVHKLSTAEVFALYGSHPKLGLESPALERLKKEKRLNKLSKPRNKLLTRLIGYVFGGFNALMWLAMILAVISYQPLGGDSPQLFNIAIAVLLMLVIVVSALFYGVVDYKTSKAMTAVKQLVAEKAWVTRNGAKVQIDAVQLLVGDLVHVSLGERVPADLYLVNASLDLHLDRSLLTGESEPVPGSTSATDNNPLETHNLAFSSTFVVQGYGTGVVFATGDKTVIGEISRISAAEVERRTILQKELDQFTFVISCAALSCFCLSMIVWGFYTHRVYPGFADVKAAIINSIGCLTSLTPPGLPVCVALALTIVARRMAERKVLVKNLSIIGTVGAMSILCSDKTGTLTQGTMNVEKFQFVNDTESSLLSETKVGLLALRICHFCSDSRAVNGSGISTTYKQNQMGRNPY
jgi:sodium/potassium-transporting ATPase subunit alpha